jgi:hypothetical protein
MGYDAEERFPAPVLDGEGVVAAVPRLSRRGFLLATASASASGVLVPAAKATPTPQAPQTPAPCVPNGQPPGVMHATGSLGSLTATVDVSHLPDVVALRYQLANTGDAATTYVVSYVDQLTTFSSRATPVTLDAGGRYEGLLYGAVDHGFLFYADLPDGTTLTLGPLNRMPPCVSSRKQPKPVFQPPPHRHGKGG